ncbi:radical SAM protein [bacterium]|nr:radical SAM protein [bacterium]
MLFDILNKKYKLYYFCTAIVKHCNLNCKYCDHFSPLADVEFKDVKQLEKEFKQIKKIIELEKIGIMGGEPLLHPDLVQILNTTKMIFPETQILLVTNGILLDKLSDDFWITCNRNKVGILISKLNIKINTDEIKKKIRQFNVMATYYGADSNEYKKMYKPVLDLNGQQCIEEMHEKCWQNKGKCNYYENGKLYKCSIAGNIDSFNKFFGKNLEITKKDYIDIYKTNFRKIEEYFNNPIDFCRYCNLNAIKYDLDWEISKKDISEWTM